MEHYGRSFGIGSNRLKKAIERNRRKQLQKRSFLSDKTEVLDQSEDPISGFSSGKRLPSSPSSTYSSPHGRRNAPVNALSRMANRTARPVEPLNNRPTTSLAGRLRRTEGSPSPAKTMFYKTPPPRSPISPLRPVGTLRQKINRWSQTLLLWVGAIVCCILLGRLIFAQRGVIDYYSQEELIRKKIHQTQLIKSENKELSREIRMLEEDPVHQRRMARKHLGVIAKDEYLVLFAREKSSL